MFVFFQTRLRIFVPVHKKVNISSKLVSKKILNISIDNRYHKLIYIEQKIQQFLFELPRAWVTFIEHVLIRNIYTNLISTRSLEIFYKTHLVDSLTLTSTLSALWIIRKKRFYIDIGTGNGFPGIILSIILPKCFFFLIDPTKKKVNFHYLTLLFLGLKNSKILLLKTNQLCKIKIFYNPCSIILTRAICKIVLLFDICFFLIQKENKLIMMKNNNNITEELKESMNSKYFKNIKIKNITVTSIKKKVKFSY
ncbi:glucose-inhibited division protein B (nucleomorph) [Cryptomonas paramecium]|uniref:Glucose-inhibited division protein B n=1 Tax=Cryptomonas paramaecium TaxID=2898 RepID=F2HIG4_9CRYP|nr:glucose-inhibited division protein B [Cryptomonas paramecium]AEA39088.1 glucose-inhibited division protein B [Cryptomonas paramecium]